MAAAISKSNLAIVKSVLPALQNSSRTVRINALKSGRCVLTKHSVYSSRYSDLLLQIKRRNILLMVAPNVQSKVTCENILTSQF